MELDEKARIEIEAQELTCPFCGHQKDLKISEEITNTETGEAVGQGIDYWTCPVCAAENDIFPKEFEENHSTLILFAEKNDWQGLTEFCKQNAEVGDFFVSMLAKWYVQKQYFEKAFNITQVLLKINSVDFQAKSMAEFLKKFLEFEKIRKSIPITIQEIMFALEDHSGAQHFLDKKTGKTITITALMEKEENKLETKIISSPERYALIEPIPPKKAFQEMEDFANRIPEAEMKQKILSAIKGKGAFRRFKDVLLNHLSLREEWFDAHNHNVFNKAIDWCIENVNFR